MPEASAEANSRREALFRGAALFGASVAGATLAATDVSAKDYASRSEALDDLDRLAAICGMRLGTVSRARSNATVLVTRFLAALERHRTVRNDVRRRFGLPPGAEPAAQLGGVDADLSGLRQSLDDLMVAYAESLPVFADSSTVSRLAVDMVEVSRLRTVVDLWVATESA